MLITDMKDMPNFNPEVVNGIDDVSKGEVYFGIPQNDFFDGKIKTVCCKKHGAMLCVAVQETGRIWRCPECNAGAFEVFESVDKISKNIQR